MKVDHEAYNQPPTNIWVKFKWIFIVQYMLKDCSAHMKEELIQLKQYQMVMVEYK